MFFGEYKNKIAKVFIVTFLCSEMRSMLNPQHFVGGVTQNTDLEDRALYSNTKTNITKASFSTAQHHASIRLKELDLFFGEGHICSGAVIGRSAVLTTAQCVYNYNEHKPYHPSELKVVLASLNRFQLQRQTLIFSVTHTHQPETFNPLSLKDNVAILMLDRDIHHGNDYVKPLTPNQAKIYNTKRQNNNGFQVTTWLKPNEDISSNHLMLFNATQVSHDVCLRHYGKMLFTTGTLCIDSNESLDADFGSPLFAYNKLLGVKSFASDHSSPAIYINVSHHAKWILGVIGNGSNQNSSFWGSLGFLLLTFVVFKRTKFMKS